MSQRERRLRTLNVKEMPTTEQLTQSLRDLDKVISKVELIQGKMYKIAMASSELLLIMNDKGCLVWLNDAVKNRLAWDDSTIGEHLFNLVHPLDLKGVKKRFLDSVSGEDMADIECVTRIKRGDKGYTTLAHDVSKTMFVDGLTLICFKEVGLEQENLAEVGYDCHVETYYLSGEIHFMVSDSPDWFFIPGTNGDMRCRDITTHSKKSTIWQCEVLGETQQGKIVMDWHLHPYQKERLIVNSGELVMQVERNDIISKFLRWAFNLPRCYFYQTITLREGEIFESHEHEYHRVISNKKASNFFINWYPKIITENF
jgi:hypothetical protein